MQPDEHDLPPEEKLVRKADENPGILSKIEKLVNDWDAFEVAYVLLTRRNTTAREIAGLLRIDVVECNARLSSMENDGFVVRTERGYNRVFGTRDPYWNIAQEIEGLLSLLCSFDHPVDGPIHPHKEHPKTREPKHRKSED